MEIYLVRHGIAQDPHDARSDPERRLTEEGREKTARMAAAFRKRVPNVGVIFHSPYLRAAETAKLFADELPHAKLISAPGLTPHDETKGALALLGSLEADASAMIVGHEPYLSTLVGRLLTGKDAPLVEFKKSGIAGFECLAQFHHCKMTFFLSPKWL